MSNPHLKRNKKYAKLNSLLLSQYAHKIMLYMNDVNKSLLKANALIKVADNLPHIVDKKAVDQAGILLAEQHQKAIKEFNMINVELEVRIKEDIGFDFDYYHTEKEAGILDDMFQKYSLAMQGGQGGQQQDPGLTGSQN